MRLTSIAQRAHHVLAYILFAYNNSQNADKYHLQCYINCLCKAVVGPLMSIWCSNIHIWICAWFRSRSVGHLSLLKEKNRPKVSLFDFIEVHTRITNFSSVQNTYFPSMCVAPSHIAHYSIMTLLVASVLLNSVTALWKRCQTPLTPLRIWELLSNLDLNPGANRIGHAW